MPASDKDRFNALSPAFVSQGNTSGLGAEVDIGEEVGVEVGVKVETEVEADLEVGVELGDDGVP